MCTHLQPCALSLRVESRPEPLLGYELAVPAAYDGHTRIRLDESKSIAELHSSVGKMGEEQKETFSCACACEWGGRARKAQAGCLGGGGGVHTCSFCSLT